MPDSKNTFSPNSSNQNDFFKKIGRYTFFLLYLWAKYELEERGQKIEDKGPRTEDIGQRTEDRGQRTEDKIPRTEDIGERTED